MLELELEKDESINDAEIQDDDISPESIIDDSEHFNNYFVWGRGTGNIENQHDLVEYIDDNGGKIDKIYLNGIEQPIVDKKVHLEAQAPITSETEIDIKKVNFGDGTYVDKTTLQQTANAIQDLNNNKVDKITGKGLSTNDYTNQEKEKLSGLENYDDSEIRDRIDDIEALIPEEASATNQLADKEYVDTHTPTLESFTLEIDWSNSSKALATINGKLEEI